MNMVTDIIKKYWHKVATKGRLLWSQVKVLEEKAEKLLRYMQGEVIKQLPSWKKDYDDFSKEQHDKLEKARTDLREKRKEWRRTFSTLDASPKKMHEMLFGDTTAIGKLFESFIIVLIFASVFVVMLDSVGSIHRRFWWVLVPLEWIFTIVFTIEYLLRVYSSPRPIRYITSFFGIIDLITVLPTYIGIFFTGAHTFLVLRVLRVLRIFRLFKLVGMMRAGSTITASLKASREKIAVFLLFVLLLS